VRRVRGISCTIRKTKRGLGGGRVFTSQDLGNISGGGERREGGTHWGKSADCPEERKWGIEGRITKNYFSHTRGKVMEGWDVSLRAGKRGWGTMLREETPLEVAEYIRGKFGETGNSKRYDRRQW